MHQLRWMGWLIVGLLLLTSAAIAAGDCRTIQRSRVYHRDRVVLQVVEPAYYYSVGAALQEQAIADRVLRLLAERLEAQTKASGLEQERLEASGAAGSPEVEGPLATCTGCHREGGEGAAAWRLSTDCREQMRAVRSVITGKMPPPKVPFTEQQAAEVIEALSSDVLSSD